LDGTSKKGAIVVLEKSTIYPRVTEEIIAPILERELAFPIAHFTTFLSLQEVLVPLL